MVSMSDRVLVTGASGLLGKYLMHTAPEGYNVCGTWFTSFLPGGYRMDVTDEVTVRRVMHRIQPTIIIHCAAIGSVDYCETHWQDAWNVNVGGVTNVLTAAEEYGAKMVFVSTNAVFDGEHSPYVETDARNPINRYGSLKREAEILIEDYWYNWLIVRPILLYGWPYSGGRGNWVTRAMDFLCNGHTLHIVEDRFTQPTYAEDCAKAIWGLVRLSKTGIFHIGGIDRVSLYEFILRVADVWDLDKKLVSAVDSDYFKDLAPRPRDTTYNLTKLWDLDDRAIRPSGIESGLRRMHASAS